MSVRGLGYIGLEAHDLDAWCRFGMDMLAMQVMERGMNGLALRMDERCQRVLVQHGESDAPAFFGLEVDDAPALQVTIAKLEAAGVAVTRASESELALRRVEAMPRWKTGVSARRWAAMPTIGCCRTTRSARRDS